MRKTKRILSLALAAVLIFSTGTMTAFAGEPDEPEFSIVLPDGAAPATQTATVDEPIAFTVNCPETIENELVVFGLNLVQGDSSGLELAYYDESSSSYISVNLDPFDGYNEAPSWRITPRTAGTYTIEVFAHVLSGDVLGPVSFTIEAKTDTSTLNGLIASAQQLYDSTKESADGSDVYTDVRWAPAADRATFADAIQAARTAAEEATTSAELATAYNTLDAAITAYEDVLEWGLATRSEPSAPSQSSSSSSSSRKPERLLAGWDSILSRALHADPEDTLSFDMTGEKYVPATLIEALQESSAALELEYRGTVYTITGDSVEVDSGRIYWPMADFLDLLRDAPAAAEEAPAADGADVSTANPDTGAHDGVGLAVALAALSLAAAGVVSLRK